MHQNRVPDSRGTADTPTQRALLARMQARFRARVIDRVHASTQAAHPSSPNRAVNPFDTFEGRAAAWERLLHSLGYTEIPAHLSAAVLDRKYAPVIEAQVRRRQRAATVRTVVRLPYTVLRWIAVDLWRTPFDLEG